MANTTSADNQDFDLGQLSKKLKNYFSRFGDSFFDAILFMKRNIVIVTILLVTGVALGIYKDQTSKLYENKIFVIPNFGSVDYLYEEVANISTKIGRQDTVFLEESGLKNPENFAKIEIEPVVEIYEFIEDKDVDEDDRKFQLFKLISENGDMKKILESPTTSRHYKNHVITITTVGKTKRSEIVGPLLEYFNKTPYFLKMKEEYVKNLNLKIAANDTILKQIDAVLNDFSRSKKNSNTLYYNDNTQLNEILKFKNKILKEQGQNRIDVVNFTSIVKEGGSMFNITAKSIVGGKMKYILPLLFIMIFVMIVRFRKYYKRQVEKRKTAAAAQ
ncbi:hypothetical protein ACX0HA_09795 [Flavobacterium hauense]